MAVGSVHYVKSKDHQTQIERHIKIEHYNGLQKAYESKKEAKIDGKRDAHCHRFMVMITQINSMKEGYSDHIDVTRHHFQFKTDEIGPVHPAQLRGESKACEFEKTGIRKMLKWGLSNWPRQNGLLP